MKIDAQIAAVQGDKLGSVESRDQTAWQLAWRRELERAQHSQPQPDHATRAAAPSERRWQHDSDAPLARSTAARTGEDDAGSTPVFKPVEQTRVVSASSLRLPAADDREPVLRVPEAPPESSPPSVATSASAFDLPELPSQAAQPTRAAALDALIARIERLDWMPKAAHVSVQGNQVSVALRDARLSEQEVKDLRWRVRKEVHSLGLELAALVVNGHPVLLAGE